MVAEVIRILGLEDSDIHTEKDLALLASRGVPRFSIENLAELLGVKVKDLADYLNVTLRSIQGYKREQLLSSNISDHIIQLASLYVLGEAALGGEAFRRWIELYNPSLGIRPIQLLKTATGIDTVKKALIRIEYSVFA